MVKNISGGPSLGFFGGVGSLVTCNEEDDSWYCELSKLVSSISMIIYLIVIAFFIYYAVKTFVLKK